VFYKWTDSDSHSNDRLFWFEYSLCTNLSTPSPTTAAFALNHGTLERPIGLRSSVGHRLSLLAQHKVVTAQRHTHYWHRCYIQAPTLCIVSPDHSGTRGHTEAVLYNTSRQFCKNISWKNNRFYTGTDLVGQLRYPNAGKPSRTKIKRYQNTILGTSDHWSSTMMVAFDS